MVLDLAALDRKSVEPETPVQLELDGARLKTGLKLLLDQVGLTYHVIAEDNLMIITDQEGSEDPAEKIWAELRAFIATCTPCKTPSMILQIFWAGKEAKGPACASRLSSKRCPRTAGPDRGSRPRNRDAVARNRTRPASRHRARARSPRAFLWPVRVAVFNHGPADIGPGLKNPNSRFHRFQVSGKRMRQGSIADESGVPARRRRAAPRPL